MEKPQPTIDELVYELLDSTYCASINYLQEKQKKESLPDATKLLYRAALRKTHEARYAMKVAYDTEHNKR